MGWFCLDTLEAAAAAAEEYRMRIKLNSISDSTAHSLFSELMRLQSSAATASFLKRCNLVATAIALYKAFSFIKASTVSCHGRDVIIRITADKSRFCRFFHVLC